MAKKVVQWPVKNVTELLRKHGVTPTAQRLEIARILFRRPAHYSAEDIYAAVNANESLVSKATVYNNLGLFVEKGLVREVLVDPSRVFYDSNTAPHHHFYHVDAGTLTDIEASGIQVNGLPELPSGTELAGTDVIVRLRKRK